MEKQEFHINYFNKRDLDLQHPDRENAAHFELASGDVGGTMWLGGDPHEKASYVYHVISKANDFNALALEVLKYLKEPT